MKTHKTLPPLFVALVLLFFSSCSEMPTSVDSESDAYIGSQTEANLATPAQTRPVVVMTWNVFLGGGLSPVLRSGSVEELIANVSELWASVEQTDFTERAEKIAQEIAVRRPDLIGLQEAVLWRSQTPGDFLSGVFTPNAETVEYDFVEILLDALERRGLHYEALKIVEAYDAEGPRADFTDVRLTDRDAILARVDHTPHAFEFSNAQGGNFDARITLELLGIVSLDVLSNWASVDVNAPDGTTFRFVTTHLSADAEQLRIAQAGELVSGPLNTAMPVILVGDMNSNAATAEPAYSLLVNDGGLTDSWPESGIGDGFTGHQNNDLLNPVSVLDERIDMVLYRGGLRALHADLAGEEQKDRTSSGLWPSDHAGVDVRLLFSKGAEM